MANWVPVLLLQLSDPQILNSEMLSNRVSTYHQCRAWQTTGYLPCRQLHFKLS